MATLASAINYARAQAQTDSNGLTDTNGIIFANECLVDFRRRLINGSIDASQTQEAYMDATVPSSGNGSTFLYPTDMFFLKAIEVNYQDTTPQNYRTALQLDVSNLANWRSFGDLRTNADRNNPQFDDRGDQFELFPAFTSSDNLSQAVRIFYFLQPTEFTSTSDSITYPEDLDYRILGWRIAANYYYSLNKFDEGDAFYQKYEDRVVQLIGTLGRGAQQPIQATVLNVGSNGWQF